MIKAPATAGAFIIYTFEGNLLAPIILLGA